MIKSSAYALIGLLAMCAHSAHGDNNGPRPALSVPVAVVAPQLTADPDDTAWNSAAATPALEMCLGSGAKGLTPVPTVVKLLWDKNYLYIRFICAATSIYSPFSKHGDPLYKGDVVEVFLDAKGDGRQWIELEVSPYNVVYESMTTLTAAPDSDAGLILKGDVTNRDMWQNMSWNLENLRTAATVQTERGKVTGWTVDLALPAAGTLRRLGLNQYAPVAFKANFLRYEWVPTGESKDLRTLIAMDWSPVMYGCPHISPQAMGQIELHD